MTKYEMYLENCLGVQKDCWQGRWSRGVGKKYWWQVFIIYQGPLSVGNGAAWKHFREGKLWSDSCFGKVTVDTERSGRRGDPAQGIRQWQ